MTDDTGDTRAAPREGSLDAPTRHPVGWQDVDFFDEAALDAELRRVFDIVTAAGAASISAIPSRACST